MNNRAVPYSMLQKWRGPVSPGHARELVTNSAGNVPGEDSELIAHCDTALYTSNGKWHILYSTYTVALLLYGVTLFFDSSHNII